MQAPAGGRLRFRTDSLKIIRAQHPDTPIAVTGPYYNPSEITGSRMGGYQLAKRALIPRLGAGPRSRKKIA